MGMSDRAYARQLEIQRVAFKAGLSYGRSQNIEVSDEDIFLWWINHEEAKRKQKVALDG